MHAHDSVEVTCLHIPDSPVADDTCVVDENVQMPPGLYGSINHRLCVRFVTDIAIVGYRTPTHGDNGVDDPVGVAARPLPADGGSQIVDDDTGPVPRQLQRVGLTDAVTCARDQCGTTFK
jgi:hypothetical protein